MGRLEKPGVAASADRLARVDLAAAHYAALKRIPGREEPDYAH